MDRKKELKEKYLQMKPEMGVFIVRSHFNNKCYIEGTKNLKGAINSTKFRLKYGSHPNEELQKEWQEYGETNFTIEVLDNLEYEKDELKTDYTEDLILLQKIWEEKILKLNYFL